MRKILTEWEKFIKQHSDTKSYVHFDKRVSLSMKSIREYVEDRNKISIHPFYPFIHFTKNLISFSKNKTKKEKHRQICYCAHLDRCVYQRYAFLINQKYNKRVLDENIAKVPIAYRDNLGKNNINFAKEAFDIIKEHKKSLILIGDFTDFFDNLNHIYLKERLCDLLKKKQLPDDYYNIFKSITKYSYWDWKLLVERAGYKITTHGVRKKLSQQKIIFPKEIFNKYKKDIIKHKVPYGIPQGSPISAVLANVYMLEFDKKLYNYVSNKCGHYFRYSDDFIVIVPFENLSEIETIRIKIISLTTDIPNLTLKQEKTHLYTYSNETILTYPEGKISQINYLGFIFDGKNVKIRPKAITKYYYRMHRKAYNIGKRDNISPNGKRISAKNLYTLYSKGEKRQTFVDYAKKANQILNLNDSETKAVIRFHKRKIAVAIKKGQITKT